MECPVAPLSSSECPVEWTTILPGDVFWAQEWGFWVKVCEIVDFQTGGGEHLIKVVSVRRYNRKNQQATGETVSYKLYTYKSVVKWVL